MRSLWFTQIVSNNILVGGWATPLKNMSQLGWWHSQLIWKNRSHVPNMSKPSTSQPFFSDCYLPNHQPEIILINMSCFGHRFPKSFTEPLRLLRLSSPLARFAPNWSKLRFLGASFVLGCSWFLMVNRHGLSMVFHSFSYLFMFFHMFSWFFMLFHVHC